MGLENELRKPETPEEKYFEFLKEYASSVRNNIMSPEAYAKVLEEQTDIIEKALGRKVPELLDLLKTKYPAYKEEFDLIKNAYTTNTCTTLRIVEDKPPSKYYDVAIIVLRNYAESIKEGNVTVEQYAKRILEKRTQIEEIAGSNIISLLEGAKENSRYTQELEQVIEYVNKELESAHDSSNTNPKKPELRIVN